MKKLIGNRAFYRSVLVLALPLLLQNAVSSFVNLLDNLMVGQVGTEPMSGVSIVNQLLFVYNLCIFGGMSGAGIYAAQFHGSGDRRGVQSCLRFNLYLAAILTLFGELILSFGGETLISSFLHETDGQGDLALTLLHGKRYLSIMLWGLIPFSITNAYASILRVTGDTKLPMEASVAALLINLGLNWLLIFGKCGFPVLGVAGAAIATVISRYAEAVIILVRVHRRRERYPFAQGLYRTLRIPGGLAKGIASKSLPLMGNELFWSLSQTVLTQCYSYRGLTAVAALNIYSVVANFFNIVMFTMGNCTGIYLGNLLGAGEAERARADAPRMMFLSSSACLVSGALLFAAAPLLPRFYNTGAEVMALSSMLMRVHACFLWIDAITNASYFILRCGGKTMITVLFDCVFSWVFYVPLAYCLIHFTALPLVAVVTCVMSMNIIKATLGIILVRKGVWIRKIVS